MLMLIKSIGKIMKNKLSFENQLSILIFLGDLCFPINGTQFGKDKRKFVRKQGEWKKNRWKNEAYEKKEKDKSRQKEQKK